MKRLISCLALIALLLTLCACSSADPSQTATGEKDKPLTPVEQLALSSQKMKNLMSARYKTTVSGDVTVTGVTTSRIRHSYDGYSYLQSRSDGKWYYVDGVAFFSDAKGDWRASMTTREFQVLLGQATYPIPAALADSATEVGLEDSVISYSLDTKAAEASLGVLGLDSVLSVSGEAKLNEEGLVTEETLTVSGLLAGKTVRCTVRTVLELFRSKEISVSIPDRVKTDAMEVEDLRALYLVSGASGSLAEQTRVSAGVISGLSLTYQNRTESLHREITLYRDGTGRKPSQYQTVQSLNKKADGREVFELLQEKIHDGEKTKTVYELTQARLLSQATEAVTEDSYPALLTELLLSRESLAGFSLTEGTSDLTVSVSALPSAAILEAKKAAELFPELAFVCDDSLQASVTASEGTFTFSKASGRLTAASFSLTANLTGSSGETVASLTAQTSLQLEYPDAITIPEMQIPTPTTPGQGA